MTLPLSRRELLTAGVATTACAAPGVSATRSADRPAPMEPADAAAIDASDGTAAVDALAADEGARCGLEDPFAPSLRLAEVPLNGGVVDLQLNVVLARDGRGLYAFSAVCPHEGCVVRITARASTLCPCHDSTFDDDGAWTGGPARRPLLNHPVEVCEGRVWVDRSLGVPLGTRRPL